MSPFRSDSRYVNLGTWRKNGVMVPTPVWYAPVGAALYAFSTGEAGKVKRLRNASRAQVAICDWRGTLLGEWYGQTQKLILQMHHQVKEVRAL